MKKSSSETTASSGAQPGTSDPPAQPKPNGATPPPAQRAPLASMPNEMTLDQEIAQLFCAGVDLTKVHSAIRVMRAAVLAHDEQISVQTVAYAAAGLLADALISRNELSPSFRVKILAGFGDLSGSMLRVGLLSEAHALASQIVDPKVQVKEKPRQPEQEHPLDEIFTTLVDAGEQVYSIEEFRAEVEDRAITDDDGEGRFAIKSEPDSYYQDPGSKVKPSKFNDQLRGNGGATHVVWYSK